jgi:uncharacterized membrane protein
MSDDSSRQEPVLIPDEGTQQSGAASRIRNYFLTGLILVGPLYITVSLTWWLINWADDVMRPVIPMWMRTETYLHYRIPGVGLIVAFLLLTLLGFLTANLVGRTLVETGEKLLNRMPIVRPIYKTMKQIFETLFSKSGSSFRKVALAEFPTGMWSVVFLTPSPSPYIADRLPGSDFVSCFLPCTPNPTTGFFFYAPRNKILELDITVEQAMTLIMSAGMVQPSVDVQKKLAALADAARAGEATAPQAVTVK